ncbi:MAG: Gfo/Idh/MocA family oxidoreductase [Verrucomicrobia bacterium]|nr:Gfo/Idh/MocA family oxidoreductase [Verrucomicrobiota bacterium]
MKTPVMNRRNFITTAAAATSVLTLNRSAWSSVIGANERVRFVLVGCGGRGQTVTYNMIRQGGELVGLCDLNPERINRAAESVADIQKKKPKTYHHMMKVFDDKDVDAVIIATPDHWHGPAAILALNAGKDVYVEKPHAHNIWESQQMQKLAKKNHCILQVGTQNRSAPYNHKALDYVKSGNLGDIRLVKVYNLKPGDPFHLKDPGDKPRDFDWNEWTGPAAMRDWHQDIFEGGWHHYWTYSGGDLADDAAHQIDLAAMLMGDPGFPLSVSSAGGRLQHKGDDSEVPDLLETVYEFPEFIMTLEHSNFPKYMRKTDGSIRRSDEFPYWTQNATRIELYGSELMMTIGRHGGGWIVTTAGGRIKEKVYGRPGDEPHCKNFLESVKSRKAPNANLDKLHSSTALLHLANIAHRVGNKKLWLNTKKERFKGNKAANALLKREYRKGFEVTI